MAHTVGLGTVNFPKLLRHLGHRTNQVRDLVFARDAIKRRDVKTTKADSSNIAGPAVSFGYETDSSASQSVGTDTVYHTSSPELIIPGLNGVQSPIVSRSGKLEPFGHRITGACTFYLPSLDYIKSLDNFSETTQFNELETYDKLLDIERVIIKPDDYSATASSKTYTFDNATAGYEIDRLQFKIRTSGTLDYIQLTGNQSGSSANIKWDGNMALSSTDWITIDIPVRGVGNHSGASGKNITTTSVYKDGTRYEFSASNIGGFDIDKLYGDSSNELSSLIIALTGSASIELKEIYLYKSAEWRVETIKDYRNEYMELGAVRVRGDRGSRRRAYG